MSNPLYTPFSTHLSTSAQETELRLRSIFQWKKRRPPVALLAAVLAVAVGAGSLVGCNQPIHNDPSETPAPTKAPIEQEADVQLSQMNGTLYNHLSGAWENSGDARYFFYVNEVDDAGILSLMYDIATGDTVETPFGVPGVDPFTLNGLGVYMHPERTAVVYGNPAGPSPLTVQLSPDKGQSWQAVEVPYDGPNATNVFVGFTSVQDGWIFVEAATDDGMSYALYTTQDGGTTWQQVQNDLMDAFRDTLTGVNFVTPDIGFVSSANPQSFRVARTADGGAHWQLLDLPDLGKNHPGSTVQPMAVSVLENNLRMPFAVSDQNGVYYGMLISEDLGETWQDTAENGTAGLFENEVARFHYPADMEWRMRQGEDGTRWRFTPKTPGPGQVEEMEFSIFEGSYLLDMNAGVDEIRQQLEGNIGYLWDSVELYTLKTTQIEGRPARWKTIHYVKDGIDKAEITLEVLDGGRGTAVVITGLLEDLDHCQAAADQLDFHFTQPLLPYGKMAQFDDALWTVEAMPDDCTWSRIEPESSEDPIQGMEIYFPDDAVILQLWSQGNPALPPDADKPLRTCPGMNDGTWQVYHLPDDAAEKDELLLFLLDASGKPTVYTGRALVDRDEIKTYLDPITAMLESLAVKPL